MVFKIASSLMGEAASRSMAGPLKTACVQQAYTSFAPWSASACAPWQMVPAVSIMSSTIRHFLPSMSPMMFMTSMTFALGRRLSMIAIGQLSLDATFLARDTLPISGDTTTKFSSTIFLDLK